MKIKKQYNYDECAAMKSGLKYLRRHSHVMSISIEDGYLKNDIVKQYFKAEDGSDDEAALEDAICASAVMCCNDNIDIFGVLNKEVSKLVCRELRSDLRSAKIDYLFQSGKFGKPGSVEAERERTARLKDNAIVEVCDVKEVDAEVEEKKIIDRLKNSAFEVLKNTTMKKLIVIILSTMIKSSPIVNVVTILVTILIKSLPAEYQPTALAKDAVDKTLDVIKSGANVIANTDLRKMVTSCVEGMRMKPGGGLLLTT